MRLLLLTLYPEWPHRQGGCLACWNRCSLSWAETAPIYTMLEALGGGTAHEGRGCDQSIGSSISDAIVRNWLWSTETSSSPLGYFSRLLQVVGNCQTFCGSRFSTGRLLAKEDFFHIFSCTLTESSLSRAQSRWAYDQIIDSTTDKFFN